jgi:hypothetical protein
MKIFFHTLLISLLFLIKSSDETIKQIESITDHYNNTIDKGDSDRNSSVDPFYNNDIIDLYYININDNNNSNRIENITFIPRRKTEKILFENIKYLNKNDIFRNFPRGKNETFPTFTKYKNKSFDPWPNASYNEEFDGTCLNDKFISIIAFEFDNKNNIYILDEGNDECPINLYVFNSDGNKIKDYFILNNTDTTLKIIDFVLDIINNYIYISFYNQSYNNKDKYEMGLLVKNLANNDPAEKVLFKDQKIKYDEKYEFENYFIQKHFPNITKKYFSVTLSCDGKVLFFAPLSSRMIFSVLTETIRKKESISLKDVNEAYKNDACFTMISGNLGNLYLNGIENNVTYIAAQVDNDLKIFSYKGIDKRNNNENMTFTIKMSIRDGILYIECKDIIIYQENEEVYTVVTTIFGTEIDKEKSYVYKCAGLAYKWDMKSYILWGMLLIVIIFVLVFVFIENKEDRDINNKNFVKKNK